MPSTDNAHPAFALISAAGLALLVVVAKLPATKLFNLDGLALASGALILFVASIVAAFAWRHMRASRRGRFFLLTAGLVASTLALSTEQSFFDRPIAAVKPECAILRTSSSA